MVKTIDLGRCFDLTTSDKIKVTRIILHENKKENSLNYTGYFELIGSMLIGKIEQKTILRFQIVDDFETYLNALDKCGYDSDNNILTGWLYKLNTSEFNRINRSQYGRGTDFKQDIVEYTGSNCYFPKNGNCFLKFISHLTGKDYMDEFLTFIGDEQSRSNVLPSARIQPFCKKHKNDIGCYDGFRVCPRKITQRNIALFMYKNHFCRIWELEVVLIVM